jgi:uncharacterized hydantoinase/oxoprolinase family protein
VTGAGRNRNGCINTIARKVGSATKGVGEITIYEVAKDDGKKETLKKEHWIIWEESPGVYKRTTGTHCVC